MRVIKKSELKQIIEKHLKWLNNEYGERADLSRANLRYADISNTNLRYTNLRGADLRYANLIGADLSGANLDFSCMPLWCGDLKVNYDEKQIIQQLYHTLSHVQFSENVSKEFKKTLLNVDLVKLANKFHRVDECGELTID